MKIIFSFHTPVQEIYEAFRDLKIEGANEVLLEMEGFSNGYDWTGRRVITTERTGDYVELMKAGD